MPFSPTKSEADWTEIYTEVFQPALNECGYTCSRAEVSTGNLVTSIIEHLIEADIAIVDVTDKNANVFYELGVRHSLCRGTIIVSQGTEHVPSDLKGYWFLTYGLRPALVRTFKSEIKRILELFEKDPLRSDNPVSDFLDKAHRSSVRETNRDNLKKLGALITELSGNSLALRQQALTGKPQLLSVGCIQLLLQTRYLDVGPEMLKRAYELEYHLEVLRREGSSPHALWASTMTELETFTRGISDVRDSVSKGEFTEPTTISMMTWTPLDNQPTQADARANRECSTEFDRPSSDTRADDSAEIFFSEIKMEDGGDSSGMTYSTPTNAKNFCRQCGYHLAVEERFCMQCGNSRTREM